MEIEKQKIDETHKALNELNFLIKSENYNTIRCNEILDRHKINRALMTYAVKCKIFERIDKGKYKSNLKTIDPIHARNCIIEARKRDKENYHKNKSKKNIIQPKAIEMPLVIPHIKVPRKNNLKKEKQISVDKELQRPKKLSILWGLIKIER